jgi:hypothetical protein
MVVPGAFFFTVVAGVVVARVLDTEGELGFVAVLVLRFKEVDVGVRVGLLGVSPVSGFTPASAKTDLRLLTELVRFTVLDITNK